MNWILHLSGRPAQNPALWRAKPFQVNSRFWLFDRALTRQRERLLGQEPEWARSLCQKSRRQKLIRRPSSWRPVNLRDRNQAAQTCTLVWELTLPQAHVCIESSARPNFNVVQSACPRQQLAKKPLVTITAAQLIVWAQRAVLLRQRRYYEPRRHFCRESFTYLVWTGHKADANIIIHVGMKNSNPTPGRMTCFAAIHCFYD